MSCQLTLLVPGLLQPPQPLQVLSPQDQPAFKLLNRFFARARESRLPASGFYATLFHLFGISKDAQSDYPVAALTHLLDADENHNDWHLRCDPVSIQADMDRLVLMGHDSLGLTETDANLLLDFINAHVQQDGWQIEASTVDRWYVKGTKKNQVTTTPPLELLANNIKYGLPTGPDGPYWCSIMNECQMLLHDLPLNEQRQAKGLMPINSLWFWGGGVLPESSSGSYDVVYGDAPLLAGLAQHTGCEYEQAENIWQAIQQQQNKNILVVMDELQTDLENQDIFYWLDWVKQFEQTSMQAVMNLLKVGDISQVTLLAADGRAFELTRSRLRHWWQRQAKFRSLLETDINRPA